MIAGIARLARRLLPASPIDAGPSRGSGILPTGPTANQDALTPRPRPAREIAAAQHRLQELGIRLIPFGRDAAVTIVSDIDASRRDDYLAYRRQLVDELGLDFGDSWFYSARSRRGRGTETSLMFFRYDADPDDRDGERDLAVSLTFAETLREAHRGNLSHPHCLSTWGPQLALLSPDSPDGTSHAVRPTNDAVQMMPVFAVQLAGAEPGAGEIELELVPGAPRVRIERDTALDRDGDETRPPMSWFHVRVADDARRPTVDEILAVRILGGGAAEVRLVGLWAEPVQRMISEAHHRWGIRTRLWIDHNARCMLAAGCERHRGGLVLNDIRAARAQASGPVSLYGRVTDPEHGYSVLTDDPEGTTYALPELIRCGLRLVNPSGLSGERGGPFHILETTRPITARDGSPLYAARRLVAELPDPGNQDPALVNDMGTRTAGARIDAMLDSLGAHDISAGACVPMYTHLGNIRPKSDRTDPYLPAGPLSRLQRAVYGAHCPPDGLRVWMAPAAEFYDYAHMLGSIAARTTRPSDSRIEIRRAPDGHDARPVPEDENHLNGITFESDDPWARITLDGAPARLIHRTESSPSMLTVLGRGPTRSLLHPGALVEPFAGRASLAERGPDRTPDEPSVALGLTTDDTGTAHARLDPLGVCLPGSQAIVWEQRFDQKFALCVVLETETGHRFGFGDLDAAPEKDRDAWLASERLPAPPGLASTIRVGVFHGMRWSRAYAGPDAGSRPLPSHPLRSVELFVSGPPGARGDLIRLELLRPRSTGGPDTPTVLLGGRIGTDEHPAPPGSIVRVRAADGSFEASTTPDALGCFVIESVPRGAVLLIDGESDVGALECAQGPRIDALTHNLDLHLRSADDGSRTS